MVNRVTLTGHLGADPEVRHFGDDERVANVRLASTEHYTDRNSREAKEATEWHRLVFFGRLAEIASQYLVKGSRIYVDGRLRTRKWVTDDGQNRYTTEVVVTHLEMMGGTRPGAPVDGSGSPDEGQEGGAQPGGGHTGNSLEGDDWTREYDEASVPGSSAARARR
jgi:single-strand DNA-binding protein